MKKNDVIVIPTGIVNRLTYAEAIIYGYLYTSCDKDGKVLTTCRQICETFDYMFAVQNVNRWLRNLEEKGLIKELSNNYSLREIQVL